MIPTATQSCAENVHDALDAVSLHIVRGEAENNLPGIAFQAMVHLVHWS